MREEKNERNRKLWHTGIIITLISIIIFASIYTYVSNSVNSALITSLETFGLESAISTPTLEGAELNITFILTNPTEFPITINAIKASFSINNIDIGGVDNINPNETVLAGKHNYFYFYRHVTGEKILDSLQNATYKLRVTEGSYIRGSASYFFFQTQVTKSIVFSEIVHNPQAKS